MPIPFLLAGAAALAGIAGLAKGGEALSNNKEARELIDSAQYMYDSSKERLERQREDTSQSLDNLGSVKLESWANDIGTFIKLFKMFKNVQIQGKVELNEKLKMQISTPTALKNMEVASLKAAEVVQAGVSSLGAGALAGIASYGGAMMFASASTGAAISTLSGVAATNATLAWFGGGSLAAGGLGMAGGTAVLGGIVAGPVLAVAGFIMAAKSEENVAKARKTYSEAELACEKMDTMTDFMKEVSDIAENYREFITSFSAQYQIFLDNLREIQQNSYEIQKRYFWNRVRGLLGLKIKVDFKKLSNQDQKALQMSWLLTQILYSTLTAPILTQNGDLDEDVYNTLSGARESSQKMLGAGE